MCHINSGENFDRPLVAEDFDLIWENYAQRIDRETAWGIFARICDQNHPQPAVLVMIFDLIARWRQDDTGSYPLVVAPFSAMDLQTGERVQSREMVAFHTVFESFVLAQRNVEILNEFLSEKFDGQIHFFCDCGSCFMPNEEKSKMQDFINGINAFRAFYESIGTAVIRTENFETADWQTRTLDFGARERAAYERMFAILAELPARKIVEPVAVGIVRENLARRFAQKNAVIRVEA